MDRHVWSRTYYAGNHPESVMSKSSVIFFYGPGGEAEARTAAEESKAKNFLPSLRDASAFTGEIERTANVVILPSVPGGTRAKIEAAYLGKVPPGRGSDKWNGEVTVFSQTIGTEGAKHTFDHTVKKVAPRAANQAPEKTPTNIVEREIVGLPEKSATVENKQPPGFEQTRARRRG